MPSMRCYNCGKVKRCRMVMTPLDAGRAAPVLRPEYLCAPCARSLGYGPQPGPDAAYDTLEEQELARDYEHGGEA